MADNPFKRPDESGFLDNDPFAELMRMAGDDRPKPQAATFSANENFDIDLERELLGEFEPDNDPGPSRMADHWTRDPAPEPVGESDLVEPTFEHTDDRAALDADDEDFTDGALDDLDLSLDLDEGPHLPLSDPIPVDETDAAYADAPDEAVIEARIHTLFADKPITEPEPPAGTDAFEQEFDRAFSLDAAEDANPGQVAHAADPDTAAGDDLEIDLEFGDFSDDTQLAAVHEADSAAAATAESIIAPAWESEKEAAWAPPAEPSVLDDTAFELPVFDPPAFEPLAEEPQPALFHQWSAADLRAEGPVESMDRHVQPVDESSYEEDRAERYEPSVEAVEFAALDAEPELRSDVAEDDDVLGDIESWLEADLTATPEPVLDVPEEPSAREPAFAPEPEPAPVAAPLSLEDELAALLGDDPVEPLPPVQAAYGREADIAFEDAPEPATPVSDELPAFDEFDLPLDLDFQEPELHGHDAEPDFAVEDDFQVDRSDDPDAWQDEAAESDQPPAAGGELVEEPVAARRSGPFAMLAAFAPAMARFGGGERAAAAKANERAVAAAPLFGMARADRPVAPEIETVDVDDQPVALADDLDIPDLHEPEEVAPLFSPDDLEAELDVAFGSLAPEEEPAQAPVSHAQTTSAEGEAVPLQGTLTGDYAYVPAEYNPAAPADNDFGDVDFDYDPDAETDGPAVSPRDGLRRKYFILGGVAAVALVAGIGYFAVGGPIGNGLPAIIRADSEPVRVRPENRGGATVPNQDSSAYRRATGATGVPGEGQEQLVTTAEEPLDVRSAVAPAPAASEDFPMVGMEEIPMLDDEEASALLATVKGDDRMMTGAEAAADDDVIAIAPRRVRTMVVRPDGTLVAREDLPAPATLAEQIAATNVAAAQGQGTAIPLVQDAQPIGSLVPQAGLMAPQAGEVLPDDPVMPDSVGVVPTRPQARPEANAAPAEQPVQVASTAPAAAAAVPVQPATAPVGEWSMQIASQPTAEGAQSAYQDLARRYGAVLEGKGVNIVRADIDGMGTFYRVRIPATTRDDAVQLCTQYKSAGGSCFVSR